MPQMSKRIQQNVTSKSASQSPRQLPAVRMRLQVVRQELHPIGRAQTTQAHTQRRPQFPVHNMQKEIPEKRSSQQTLAGAHQAGSKQQQRKQRQSNESSSEWFGC